MKVSQPVMMRANEARKFSHEISSLDDANEKVKCVENYCYWLFN